MKIIALSPVIAFLILCGCSQVTENHSQWRGESANLQRLNEMYALAIPLCDGKSPKAHKKCVDGIRQEYAARFADRHRAYYTASSVESLMVKTIVVSCFLAELGEMTSDAVSESSGGDSMVCATNKLSGQFSVSLTSFVVMPVSCA